MITVVFAIKNKDAKRVKNCIDSLRFQDCKIIVVDYGSDDTSWYPYVLDMGYIAVRRDTEVFNKCRALNIGMRLVSTQYVISSDIDNIFGANFIEKAKEKIVQDKVILRCRKIELDASGNIQKMHQTTDYGSCFGIDMDWVRKVGGYDEHYTLWGREDNDIYERAKLDGYKEVWLDEPMIRHQWHPLADRSTLKQNIAYFNSLRNEKNKIVRNGGKWGEL